MAFDCFRPLSSIASSWSSTLSYNLQTQRLLYSLQSRAAILEFWTVRPAQARSAQLQDFIIAMMFRWYFKSVFSSPPAPSFESRSRRSLIVTVKKAGPRVSLDVLRQGGSCRCCVFSRTRDSSSVSIAAVQHSWCLVFDLLPPQQRRLHY